MRRLKSVEKIVREETLKKIPNSVIFDFRDDEYSNNVKLSSPPNPLLKLKIRNTRKYLKWRPSILKR